MKNTTIAGVSGYGKSLKHWRTRLYALFLTLYAPFGNGQTGVIATSSVTGIRRNSWLFGLLLLLSFLGGNTTFAQTVTIGTGTSLTGNTSDVTAFGNRWPSFHMQLLFTASELQAAGVTGNITAIAFNIADNGSATTNPNYTVKMGATALTALTTTFQATTGFTTVFPAATYTHAVGWNTITFSTPYAWDGSSNIIMDFAYSGADATYNATTYYTTTTTNTVTAQHSSSTISAANTRPNIRITYVVPSACSGTPTGGTAAASASTGNPNTAFTVSVSGASSETGYTYQWETATSSSGPWTEISGATSAGLSATAPSTLGVVTYYRRKITCTASGESVYSSSASFTTALVYCGAPFSTYINAVDIVTGMVLTNSAGIQLTQTSASNGTNNYTVYSNTPLDLYQGSTTNTVAITFGTDGTQYSAAWIDFNQDGDFNDANENIGLATTSNGGSSTKTYTFTVPAGAALGATRMRVRGGSDNAYTVTGACAVTDYGETEDYAVNISATPPACLPPTGVSVVLTSTSTGTATWVASTSAPSNGYQYYVAPSGTTPTTSTTPTGSVAAGVLTTPLTGLTANTTYVVWVRSNCGGTTSSWVASSAFFTGYCTPAPASQDGTGITNFTLGSINNTTGSETGYYGNYSAQVANVSLGSSVSFSITLSTAYPYNAKIWVDWNDDLDFTDAGENVYTGATPTSFPYPATYLLTGTIAVPANATLGNHRLRIGATDYSYTPTPCYNGSYATYEDYTVNAFMPPAPVVTGFTPASYCAASGVITITGTDLANATLSIGGTAVTPLTTNTNTQIVATVPAGVSGTVSVTTVAGTSTSATSFNVVAPATFTLSAATATICNGASTDVVTITAGASSFDTYVWTPSTGVTGSAATGWTFNPTATTEYVLMASQSAGPCVVNATVNVTVNASPTPLTLAAVSTCPNQPVALTASGGYYYVPQTYCSPTILQVGDTGDYLNNFSFANITNNNTGDAVSDYTFYSALNANVTVGTPYTISLQSGNPTWTEYFRVWIDYNQNGAFEDSESVFNTTTGATSANAMTGTVTVPTTAYSGTTRMRVLCTYNTQSSASSDCAWDGFGEYEDYLVTISGSSYPPMPLVWSPATNLYTNAAGTTPYVAGATAATVYAAPSATATYTASSTTALGCSVSATATVTVNVTDAPTAVSPQNFTSLTYASDLEATGTAIAWYTTATGGTPLAATDAVWTGTYYATQTLNGCENQTRTPVVVSVILPEMDWVNLQWPPVLSIVSGATGDVYAQGYEEGVTPGAGPGYGVQAWVGISSANTDPSTWTNWVPMTFNTQVGNNDEFVGSVGTGLEPGTYYYATRFKLVDGPFKYGGYSVEGGGFWNGTTYTSGVLTVTCGTEAPVAAANQMLCNAATVAYLEAEGTGIQWYATATGGAALSNNTALVSGSTYYASQTVGCESLMRTAVTVTITTTPAPTALATQVFTVAGTVNDLTAEGAGIQWYAAATGGTPLDGSAVLEDGVTYYASQTVNGCESQARVAVMASIVDYQLDFVNLQWPAEVTVIEGTDATVYAQVYEASVTPGAGPGIGITVMVGISSDNTDPSTWTTWIPMTFNTQVGNNDEFMAMIGANLAPGTYYYAVAGQLYDGPYVYGGYSANGGGTWDGTVNVSGVINVICYTAAPWAVEVQQVLCGSATIASLVAEGSNIQWYAAATGGQALAADAEVVDGMVYYASQSVNGCESQQRIAVTAYISVVGTPTGDAEQEVSYTWNTVATVDDIVVEANGYVTWYYTEADAVAGTNPIPAGTEIESGTYYAVASYGDCSSAPFAVTVETVLGDSRFDLDAFNYWPNPVKDVLTMTYSEEITSVTVYNLLGQQVIALAPNATEVKIDMTALAEGAYTIHVGAGNSVETIRVVKKQ